MGRKSLTRVLTVWMNGEQVGAWTLKSNGVSEFRYEESWLASARRRPISLSMALRPSGSPYVGKIVDAFFDNLLPDTKPIRQRIQSKFKAASADAFDLLEHIGRDCVGALQLLPDGAAPKDLRTIQGQPLSESEIEELLEDSLVSPARAHAGGDDRDFRISLAGAQEKTALLRIGDTWQKPTGPTPTTHILKLPIGTGNRGIDLSTSVENEWLCSRILAAFGVAVAKSEIARFGRFKVLTVQRFDRQFAPDESWITRLPQEDFCQATGTSGGLKYESDGGPGIERIMALLQASVVAAEDRTTFLRVQLLFWLLCAVDGHAKNFSIFLLPESRYRLTPIYDVLSAYPVLGKSKNQLSPKKVRLAMAVSGQNRHYAWSEIRYRHWVETAAKCKFGASIKDLIDEVAARVPKVLATVQGEIPSGFPSHVADAIFDGLRKSAERLATQGKD
jgi:serine/threonine-protein kinase HipA